MLLPVRNRRSLVKLKDLPLEDVSAVVTAPLKVDQPADVWVAAVREGAIPQSLYDLYRIAGCLDSTKPPQYLSAYQSVAIFSFFKAVMDSLRDALVEMGESAVELRDLREREWREVGEWMRERADHPAIGEITGFPKLHSEEVARLEPRVFRSLLITASGALDLSSELVSVFVPSPSLKLKTGRAEFRKIFDFVKRAPPKEPLVSSVPETMLSQLYARLLPLLGLEDGPERDWYEFFMLYRNKVAHLGKHAHFRFGIGDREHRMYMFLRKDWPFSLEQELFYPSATKNLFGNLIEQDVVEFADGLSRKIRTVVGETVGVVGQAFKVVRDQAPPVEVLRAFAENQRSYAFRHFSAPDGGGVAPEKS